VKPEVATLLATARDDPNEAISIAAIGLHRAAARSAYYAAFHAAEALIFERTDKVAKTHSGARVEFSRLAKQDPGIAMDLPRILARAYEFKEFADYRTPNMTNVTATQADAQIAASRRFISEISTLLDAADD
jgi:uncharacterized protein (UPF0332 family)